MLLCEFGEGSDPCWGVRSSLNPGEEALGSQVTALEKWQLLCLVLYSSLSRC